MHRPVSVRQLKIGAAPIIRSGTGKSPGGGERYMVYCNRLSRGISSANVDMILLHYQCTIHYGFGHRTVSVTRTGIILDRDSQASAQVTVPQSTSHHSHFVGGCQKNSGPNPRSFQKTSIIYPHGGAFLPSKRIGTPLLRLHTVTTGCGDKLYGYFLQL